MARSLKIALLAAIALAPAACIPVMPSAMSADLPEPAAGSGSSHTVDPSDRVAMLADEVERLINVDRARVGCRPLQWDAAAAAAAQAHSDDMARRGYFSHTSPEGRTVVDRLRAHGADFRALAENVAMGQRTPQEVVSGWLNSPGHRHNIENCVYTRAGVGYRDNRWTQVFYTPLR